MADGFKGSYPAERSYVTALKIRDTGISEHLNFFHDTFII
jgi:hypothetical protein